MGPAGAGGGRPATGSVAGASRLPRTTPRCPPELAEWLEASFKDRRGIRQKWVHSWASEVERAVCCSLDRAEASGGLLEVGWMFLDAQEGREKAGEEVWVWRNFLAEMVVGV